MKLTREDCSDIKRMFNDKQRTATTASLSHLFKISEPTVHKVLAGKYKPREEYKLSKKLADLSAFAAQYKPPVDLTQVSDAEITYEYMRRFNARRKRAGGRKPILTPCEHCGESFGVAELRYHTPRCTGTKAGRA